jgi:hypothetical protein
MYIHYKNKKTNILTHRVGKGNSLIKLTQNKIHNQPKLKIQDCWNNLSNPEYRPF